MLKVKLEHTGEMGHVLFELFVEELHDQQWHRVMVLSRMQSQLCIDITESKLSVLGYLHAVYK